MGQTIVCCGGRPGKEAGKGPQPVETLKSTDARGTAALRGASASSSSRVRVSVVQPGQLDRDQLMKIKQKDSREKIEAHDIDNAETVE